MDVREKLVEILKQAPFEGKVLDEWWWEEKIVRIVEHLIANGVTVQECGHWLYDHWCEFKCSVCGEFSSSKPYKGRENYCPNCGAKMMPQPPKGE